jgi:hypothetical protein
MGTNHKVRFRSEGEIAEIAATCWRIFPPNSGASFDVVGFLKSFLLLAGIDVVVTTLGRKKGKLSIKYFDREFAQDDPAYVEFAKNKRDNYVTLNVDRTVWLQASGGDSFAREILAHETGHILLHDHFANAFSLDSTSQKLFAGTSKEDFAEWQAITFAEHLLIPNHLAQKFPDIHVLSALLNTTETFARSRLDAIQNTKKQLLKTYDSDVCNNCGNVTLVRRGCITSCDTCGQINQT